jgi:hypothetical protein
MKKIIKQQIQSLSGIEALPDQDSDLFFVNLTEILQNEFPTLIDESQIHPSTQQSDLIDKIFKEIQIEKSLSQKPIQKPQTPKANIIP